MRNVLLFLTCTEALQMKAFKMDSRKEKAKMKKYQFWCEERKRWALADQMG